MCGHKTLSKTERTARALRPGGYDVFVHQHNQSLCPRTPSFSIHLLKKGSKGPTCRISIKKKLSGCPRRSNGSKPPPRDKHPYLHYILNSLPSLEPQQRQGIGHRSGAGKSVYSLDIFSLPNPSLRLQIGGLVCGHKL